MSGWAAIVSRAQSRAEAMCSAWVESTWRGGDEEEKGSRKVERGLRLEEVGAGWCCDRSKMKKAQVR